MKKILINLYYILCRLKRTVFSFKRKLFNKNKDFTIFSNTCIGGRIYHWLGLEFKSPFINMFIYPNDFMKVLFNPIEYLDKELNFIETNEEYPIAMLGDVRIHFNHDNDKNEIVAKWKRRIERINYQNAYVVIREYKGNYVSDADLLKLLKIYKGVKIITFDKNKRKKNNYKYINLKGNKDEWKRGKSDIAIWEKQWNFTKFINKP